MQLPIALERFLDRLDNALNGVWDYEDDFPNDDDYNYVED